MRIFLTGGSSFTGYWFAHQLAIQGHHVALTFTGARESYQGLRRRRIDALGDRCQFLWHTPFGSPAFLEALQDTAGWDVLCLHGGHIKDYRSEHFSIVDALADNTREAPRIIQLAKAAGVRRVVFTGSFFEPHEGTGTQPLRTFSPFGLSKSFTWETYRYLCDVAEIPVAKFVISNPFGPYEAERFGHYLMRTWHRGEPAAVRTPAYIRDNIHVTLLAKVYAQFVDPASDIGHRDRLNPCGYIESQGDFTHRFAEAMRARLGWACDVALQVQTLFPEPKMRVNFDTPDPIRLAWQEEQAWDGIAAYYQQLFEEKTP